MNIAAGRCGPGALGYRRVSLPPAAQCSCPAVTLSDEKAEGERAHSRLIVSEDAAVVP